MKKILLSLLIALPAIAFAQNVGIGTTSPLARLHVTDSNVIFSGVYADGSFSFYLPVNGGGTRMMWLPAMGAFRAGTVSGNRWDKDSIGIYSFAAGMDTKASNVCSFAMGQNSIASGDYSTAIGFAAKSSGSSSIAMGILTNASGSFSTAMGFGGLASGSNSTSMGAGTWALGNSSTAMGGATIAKSFVSMAIGSLNDTLTGTSATAWVNTDPLLYIGNGNAAGTTRSNAVVVYKNADVDINGFTRMGKLSEGAPVIKIKKLTGTSPAVNGNIAIVHGLTASKILSVSVSMEYGLGPAETVPPFYTISTGYEYQYQVRASDILISNKSGNSANIGSMPVKIIITYEE